MRGGNVGRCRNSLAKLLLDSSLAAACDGPKDRPSALLKLIHNAQHQRHFGTDNGEVGLQTVRELHDRVEALEVNRQALGILADAAITGRAK